MTAGFKFFPEKLKPLAANNEFLDPNLLHDKNKNPSRIRCNMIERLKSYVQPRILVDGTKMPYPVDYVGVEYGLKALLSIKISFERFIYLNQNIGGFSEDGE